MVRGRGVRREKKKKVTIAGRLPQAIVEENIFE